MKAIDENVSSAYLRGAIPTLWNILKICGPVVFIVIMSEFYMSFYYKFLSLLVGHYVDF